MTPEEYAAGLETVTKRDELEFRVTPTGLIRLDGPVR